MVLALVAAVPGRRSCSALLRPRRAARHAGRSRRRCSASLWIGLALAHAVLLRDLAARRRRSSSTCWSATFIGDTGAYFGGRAVRARAARAARSRRTRRVEGLVVGVVAATLAFWFAGLYQDWLIGLGRAADRRLRRARGAARRPVRVADQARRRGRRTPAAASAPTAACWTASTRCCSRSSSATTWRSGWATGRAAPSAAERQQ